MHYKSILAAALISFFSAAFLAGEAPAAPTGSALQSSAADNVVYQEWLDSKRNRKIPVKIYLPTSGSGPFPVVIFSHGLGGSREAAPYLGKYWSEHGYFCIFVQHTGSDTGAWKDVAGQGRATILSHMKSAANPRNAIDRCGDITFVLDQLEEKNGSDPEFKGQLQLSKVAISGHSFGAGTSLAIAGQAYNNGTLRDERVRAAIYLCPPVSKAPGLTLSQRYGAIKIPGLLLTGTEDDSPINDTKAAERRLPFDNISTPHQYFVNFEGADHGVFGGRAMRGQKAGDEKVQEMVDQITLKFLDAYLKDEKSAEQWLDGDAVTNYLGKAAAFERK